MLKELATIKDGKRVTRFVVYDEDRQVTYTMDIEDAKAAAAAGNMDSLDFKDGRFIPVIRGSMAEELKSVSRRTLEKSRQRAARMSFDEFVKGDCIFRAGDVGLMHEYSDVVLADVCSAMESRVHGRFVWTLNLAFWSIQADAADRIMERLSEYVGHDRRMGVIRRYDSFIMVSLPLYDGLTRRGLLTLHEETGLRFLYNLDMMENVPGIMKDTAEVSPVLVRFLMNGMMPTKEGLDRLTEILREVNAGTMHDMMGLRP